MKSLIKTLLASGTIALATQVQAISIDVSAQNNSSSGGIGANTGISLNTGDWFCISVDPNDLWNAGPLPRWSNANGLVGNLYATGSDESLQPAGTLIGQNFNLWTQDNLSAPYGALVGQIGNGAFFLVGTYFSGQAANSGNLLLYYWDSNSYDNTEKVTITANVDCNRVPEGGWTAALLGLGMLGLGSFRRPVKVV